MKNITVLFLICFLVGCLNPAATGPIFTKVEPILNDKGSIYFYSPIGHQGRTVCLNIFFDEKKIGCLGTLGYLHYYAEPGVYKVELKPDAFPTYTLLEFQLEVKAGEGQLYKYNFLRVFNLELENMVVKRQIPIGTNYVERMPYEQAASILYGLRDSKKLE